MPTAKGGYFNIKGEQVPSVTQVLGSLGFGKEALLYWSWKLGKEGKDFKEERKRAAEVGTLVHARIEAFIRNQPPYEPNGPEETDLWPASETPYAAFLDWYSHNPFELLEAEVPLVNELYGYGGTLDALGKIPSGEIVLYDWKTSGGIYASNLLQAAAYRKLAEGMPERHYEVTRAVVLHVPQGEKPKPTPYHVEAEKLDELFQGFLGILRLHKAQPDMEPSRFRVKK